MKKQLHTSTPDTESEKSWFAIQTKPRQEATAEENLQRQEYHTYLPRIQLSKRRRGKWTHVVEPLFPRYLFVQIDPIRVSIAPIRSTRGVSGMVRFGNTLKAIPDSVIDYLKEKEDPETSLHHPENPQFRKGDSVEILDGPFAGLEGIYQMSKGEERALILIEFLGRENTITINLDAVSIVV